MSMIDSVVFYWRSPSLFRWDRFIVKIFSLVGDTVVKCYCLSRHYKYFFRHGTKYTRFCFINGVV